MFKSDYQVIFYSYVFIILLIHYAISGDASIEKIKMWLGDVNYGADASSDSDVAMQKDGHINTAVSMESVDKPRNDVEQQVS